MAGVALTGLGDALGCGWVAAGRRTLCVAGVALGDMDCHFAWQAWHLRHWAGTDDALGSGWVAACRRTLCVAGVALSDMDLHFAWQAWH